MTALQGFPSATP